VDLRPANEMSAWNSFTDIFLTILPMTIVWDLKLDRIQKLGVSVLLGLSLLQVSLTFFS
jgi:hypothetical protein